MRMPRILSIGMIVFAFTIGQVHDAEAKRIRFLDFFAGRSHSVELQPSRLNSSYREYNLRSLGSRFLNVQPSVALSHPNEPRLQPPGGTVTGYDLGYASALEGRPSLADFVRPSRTLSSLRLAPVEIEIIDLGAAGSPSIDRAARSAADLARITSEHRRVLTAVTDDLLESMPLSAFHTRSGLEASLRDALNARASAAVSEPTWKFEISSGEITMPPIGRIGRVQITAGSVNAYKWSGGIAALLYIGTIGVSSSDIQRMVFDALNPSNSAAESTEILLRGVRRFPESEEIGIEGLEHENATRPESGRTAAH